MTPHTQGERCSVYSLPSQESIDRYIISTQQTRAICNDPFVVGAEYTRTLQEAMTASITALKDTIAWGDERDAMVLHILRGGLNFGLRDALAQALSWNIHTSAYISSQRVQDADGEWHITENRYQKVYIPKNATVIFGDVVATGVSLEHALMQMVATAQEQGSDIRNIIFFTIGGNRAEQILQTIDARCREVFPEYEKSTVIYIEGIFGVADENSPLSIKFTGTDLLRSPAQMAPECVASQQEQISYPLERCTIYDAGSRAFHVAEYLDDVIDYWTQVRTLAEKGMTLVQYLTERYPESPWLADDAWKKDHNTSDALQAIAQQQLDRAQALLGH